MRDSINNLIIDLIRLRNCHLGRVQRKGFRNRDGRAEGIRWEILNKCANEVARTRNLGSMEVASAGCELSSDKAGRNKVGRHRLCLANGEHGPHVTSSPKVVREDAGFLNLIKSITQGGDTRCQKLNFQK